MKTAVRVRSAQGHEQAVDLRSLLTPELRERVQVETRAWIKSLRQVAYDGQSMRERFTYRDDSLWWFTELYLHKTRRLETAVEIVHALDAARVAFEPARLVVDSTDDVVRHVAGAFGAARHLPVDVRGAGGPRADRGWQSYLIGLTASLSRWRPARQPDVPGHPRVAAFVHTAFWRPGDADGPRGESYIGPVLQALQQALDPDELVCVGVGPRRNFRARRWWDPIAAPGTGLPLVTPIERLSPQRALAESMALWQRRARLAAELTAGDGIRAAAACHGLDLWPVLRGELEAVAMLQWPWSARAMDEAASALDQLAPATIVTYAEAGGWGRALVLEARRRRIPSVGLQHGFIYRHWLNYRHEPDEMQRAGSDAGAPIPDRTLVFDRYTAAYLRSAGQFPDDAIRVTGSARLDDLAGRFAAAATERDRVREGLGVTAGEKLVVLAAKYSEIRDDLPALVEALAGLPNARLIIKPHPAETPDVYRWMTESARSIAIAPPDADLAHLMAAADGLITRNSTVAIDGLVLGVPALVLGLPNNLSPFVEAGVMLGTASPGKVRPGLEALLYDPGVRAGLIERAVAFTSREAILSDGRAAERAATAILELTGRAGSPAAGEGST